MGIIKSQTLFNYIICSLVLLNKPHHIDIERNTEKYFEADPCYYLESNKLQPRSIYIQKTLYYMMFYNVERMNGLCRALSFWKRAKIYEAI